MVSSQPIHTFNLNFCPSWNQQHSGQMHSHLTEALRANWMCRLQYLDWRSLLEGGGAKERHWWQGDCLPRFTPQRCRRTGSRVCQTLQQEWPPSPSSKCLLFAHTNVDLLARMGIQTSGICSPPPILSTDLSSCYTWLAVYWCCLSQRLEKSVGKEVRQHPRPHNQG